MSRLFAIVENKYWFDNSNKTEYIVLEKIYIPKGNSEYMYVESKHNSIDKASNHCHILHAMGRDD